ncbi:MAG: hypothetical protein ABSA47_11015 [Verrucomicrobiota bacterium]|jgi:hypothetical protein
MPDVSKVRSGGGAPLYQLKITLNWSDPPIWRRVVARADMPLDRLHDLIQNLLEIMADPKHPEQAEMKDWLGGELDAERFNLNEVNAALKRLKA